MWEYLCTDYLYLCTDCLCHIFPQGVLENITLVFGRTGDGGARDGTWCEERLTLCSVAVTGLLFVGFESQVAGE